MQYSNMESKKCRILIISAIYVLKIIKYCCIVFVTDMNLQTELDFKVRNERYFTKKKFIEEGADII